MAAVETPREDVVGAFLASSPGWTEFWARPPRRTPEGALMTSTYRALLDSGVEPETNWLFVASGLVT